ncbi:MAG: hypothetical protein AB1646_13965 [Thermodesulfobacteriota bacterium]
MGFAFVPGVRVIVRSMLFSVVVCVCQRTFRVVVVVFVFVAVLVGMDVAMFMSVRGALVGMLMSMIMPVVVTVDVAVFMVAVHGVPPRVIG